MHLPEASTVQVLGSEPFTAGYNCSTVTLDAGVGLPPASVIVVVIVA